MKTTRIITLSLLPVSLSLGLASLSSPASAQQLDKPDLVQTFPAGSGPYGLAFDGDSIWVVDYDGDAMTKLRASDGTLLGTFPVVNDPAYATFDGANLWVTNSAGRSVTKLRASDGALLGTFTVGNFPIGILFDGENIWVTNSGDDTVSKLQ